MESDTPDACSGLGFSVCPFVSQWTFWALTSAIGTAAGLMTSLRQLVLLIRFNTVNDCYVFNYGAFVSSFKINMKINIPLNLQEQHSGTFTFTFHHYYMSV